MLMKSLAEQFLHCAGCNKIVSSTEALAPPLAPGSTSSKSLSPHSVSLCNSRMDCQFQRKLIKILLRILECALRKVLTQSPQKQVGTLGAIFAISAFLVTKGEADGTPVIHTEMGLLIH
ncbi:hypothetical protein AV530_010600 [Patagioenas fasciata monilis]|uniref:Uncharacterized protein n=1 Tax=Patagioenas fasciata monilis TaxID=372326 RepID=A0A1V4KFH3_PATFA|nr:hypothetical protein AV530_010600 [Patagioenas fasciata monilis]